MAASDEATLAALLYAAQNARDELRQSDRVAVVATVKFMHEAQHLRWSWERIGHALGVSATGARRYYDRNKKQVHSVTTP